MAFNVFGPVGIISRKTSSSTLYYLYDGHGDVVQLTNASGTAIITYKYDAFGNHDFETNTIYLRARNYSPTTGRFLKKDTYKGKYNDTLSLNRYTYSYNNPLKYKDPSGQTPQLTQWEIDNLTEAQQNAILTQKTNWENATTDAQRTAANNAANAIRQQAGFTGGTDGATYTIIRSNNTYYNTGVTISLTTRSGTTGTTINNSGTINTVTVQNGSSTSIINSGSIGMITNNGNIGTVTNNSGGTINYISNSGTIANVTNTSSGSTIKSINNTSSGSIGAIGSSGYIGTINNSGKITSISTRITPSTINNTGNGTIGKVNISIPSPLPDNKSTQDAGKSAGEDTGFFIELWNIVGSFSVGFVNGAGQSLSYGVLEPAIDSMNPGSPPNGIAYSIGKILGGTTTGIAGGFITGGGVIFGTVTAPTGVGAVAGAGAAAYGATVVASSAGVAAEGIGELYMYVLNASSGSGGGGTSGGNSSNNGSSNSSGDTGYQAPDGGGGVTNRYTTSNGTVTFGHGGRHVASGDNVSAVERAIANDAPRLAPGQGRYNIPIRVNGQNYVYNAYGVEGGIVNIGTYHPVP